MVAFLSCAGYRTEHFQREAARHHPIRQSRLFLVAVHEDDLLGRPNEEWALVRATLPAADVRLSLRSCEVLDLDDASDEAEELKWDADDWRALDCRQCMLSQGWLLEDDGLLT